MPRLLRLDLTFVLALLHALGCDGPLSSGPDLKEVQGTGRCDSRRRCKNGFVCSDGRCIAADSGPAAASDASEVSGADAGTDGSPGGEADSGAEPPSATWTIQLSSPESYGNAPHLAVDLIAVGSGSVAGPVQWEYDCNAADGLQFNGVTTESESQTFVDACDYSGVGNYVATVRSTRQGVVSQAQMEIVVTESSGGITARATIVGPTRCVAPCAVFFDATATSYPGHGEADRYLALEYQWDFGDPTAGNWRFGARANSGRPSPRNNDRGFVASHIYERPGTYQARLSVFAGSNGDTLDAPLQVDVVAAQAQWPGQQTICVASNQTPVAGQDGCPAGAAVARDADFNRALETHCNIDDAAVRCLLRAGDTFVASGLTEISNTGPSLLGSYGAGRATVNATGSGLLRLTDGNRGLRIVDLYFTSTSGTAEAIHALAGSVSQPNSGAVVERLLLLRTEIEHFNQGIALRGSSYPANDPVSHMHREIAIVDSVIHHGSGHGGNDVYIMGNYYAIIGSRISDKHQPTDPEDQLGEHVLRSKYARRSVVAHNSAGLLENVSPNYGCNSRLGGQQGNLVFKFVSGFAVNLQPLGRATDGYTREFVVRDNYISGCRNNGWDMVFGPTDGGTGKSAEHLRLLLIEGNHFVTPYRERSSGSGQQLRVANSTDFVVRNNIFDPTGSEISITAITLGQSADQVGQPGYQRPGGGRIYNNTFYDASASGVGSRRFLSIQSDEIQDTRVANNLVVRSTGDVSILSGASANASCCGGSCPGSCNVVLNSSPFNSTPTLPSRLQQFQLGTLPPSATEHALAGFVESDIAGQRRLNGGDWLVGAWKGRSSPQNPPPPPPSCSDDCQPEQHECAGNGWRSCGQHDADACLDWSAITECANGASCQAGRCEAIPRGCSENCRAINLHSTFGNNPRSEIWVSWRGDTGDTLEYSTDNSFSRSASGHSLVSAGDRQHHVALTGLVPGTRYFYRVANTNAVGSFETAPDGTPDFSFVIPGDVQGGAGGNPRWRQAVSFLLGTHPEPIKFWTPLGDQVSRGLLQSHWDAFFANSGTATQHHVLMPMIGNHENYGAESHDDFVPQLYLDQFRLPDNGDSEFANYYYSFEYGDAQFIVMSWLVDPDSDPTMRERLRQAQTDWLRQLMPRITKKWRFVLLHAPIYTTYRNQQRGDMNPEWNQLWEDYRVNAVINGDTHFHEVSVPIRNDAQVASYAEGTLYYGTAGIRGSPTGGSAWWTADTQDVEDEALIATVDGAQQYRHDHHLQLSNGCNQKRDRAPRPKLTRVSAGRECRIIRSDVRGQGSVSRFAGQQLPLLAVEEGQRGDKLLRGAVLIGPWPAVGCCWG